MLDRWSLPRWPLQARDPEPSTPAPPAADDGGLPTARLLDRLILDAIRLRASDVHLESHADGLRVRYRIDGVLQDIEPPPPGLKGPMLSRLKVLARLDIAERRMPQDGRIRFRTDDAGGEIDIRVSTLPALDGESIVLRLITPERERLPLEALGMGDDTLRRLVETVSRPNGMIIATGPSGSGKTTTLYALTQRISSGREKIITVEDPIESRLPGASQVAVNLRTGLTFAAVLRAMLRQDPDILLVGEIRDAETAEIATHAALTGHLVLSTLHTTDAPGALTRLLDLGVPDYLLASTIELVLAQRLVRAVCRDCAADAALEPDHAAALGTAAASIERVRRGTGCDACRGTGYRGRTGVYELLVLDEEIREAVRRRAAASRLQSLAGERGMRTLRQDGLRQVEAGVTTPEEVLRVT